jgi:hypothetical protein
MYTQWQNIKKPSKDERNWLELIYGKRNANNKFNKLGFNLKNTKSSSNYNFKYKKDKINTIKIFDVSILKTLNNLDIKYKDIKSKYRLAGSEGFEHDM